MRRPDPTLELQATADELSARIEDEAQGRSSDDRPFKREVFVELMVADLAANTGYADPQLAFHSHLKGTARVRVDGVTVSNDGAILYVFAAEYSGSPIAGKLDRLEAGGSAMAAHRFVRFAIDDAATVGMSDDARALKTYVAELWAAVTEVKIIVLSDSAYVAKPLADPPMIDGRTVTAEVFDLLRLQRLTAPAAADIGVDFRARLGRPLARVSRSIDDDEYECSLLVLPGRLLADLYEEHGVGLLELNVRAFLGSANKVNAGIRRTLKNEPKRFLAYNNGISATAREIVLGDGEDTIASIVDLQIVNGGQTLAALHHAAYVDKNDISNVEVATKLTVIKQADIASFIGEVSSYANTQSIVQLADFSANRPFHIELERLSRRIWIPGERGQWFFERTRGQYNVARSFEGSSNAARKRFRDRFPPTRRFSKTDVARYENSWRQLPHEVSNGAQYNYRAWLNDIETEDWSPDETWFKELVAKAIVYRAIRKTIREAEFRGYWAQIATYAMALTSLDMGKEIDLLSIWTNQGLPPDLLQTLGDTCTRVDETIRVSAGKQNISQWCKRVACWDAVRATSHIREPA